MTPVRFPGSDLAPKYEPAVGARVHVKRKLWDLALRGEGPFATWLTGYRARLDENGCRMPVPASARRGTVEATVAGAVNVTWDDHRKSTVSASCLSPLQEDEDPAQPTPADLPPAERYAAGEGTDDEAFALRRSLKRARAR